MKKTLCKWMYYFVTGASSIMMAWILASWIDVVAHNATDQIYAVWNLFNYIF